jgi:Delta3-Delta2-enoyl-CoA isomerase
MIVATDYGEVRELRLNRPPVNALSAELIAALRQSLETAVREGVQAVVLSGARQRFCAGLDVPLLATLDMPAIERVWRELYALLGALACSPIPVVAAITGHAPAGGTVLPLFCDWRVMAEGEWKIGLSEVRVGLAVGGFKAQVQHFLNRR